MELRRIALAIMLSAVMLSAIGARAEAQATPQPQVPADVKKLFDSMSPEESVGQLFLVTFTGTDTGDKSPIYDLIVNWHVGGVTLLAANDNFVAAPDTVQAANQLTRNLQELEWQSALHPPVDPTTGTPITHAYVPLFIATSQDGDGPPGDQILAGLTPLPSELAIGATWSPDLAEEVGKVAGQELSALGINMYFGPTLDVLENPSVTPANRAGHAGALQRLGLSGRRRQGRRSLCCCPRHYRT